MIVSSNLDRAKDVYYQGKQIWATQAVKIRLANNYEGRLEIYR
jgi:hypothetical protein